MVRSPLHCPRRFVGFACLVLLCMAAGRTAADDLTPRPTMGEIIRLDAAADALLPANATIEVLAAGLDWSEGPVWLPKADTQPGGGGFVVFSDVPRNKVYQWKEGAGLSVFLEPSGYTGLPGYSSEQGSNGLAINAAGELISCEHGDRRVSVLTRRGGKRTLADTIDGKRFNSPNDCTIDKRGAIYFTDPPYGLPEGAKDTKTREIAWHGIYRIAASGGVTLLSKEMTFPNGITLSPDEKTLYVAQSDPQAAIWKAFPVNIDGTLGPSRLLRDATTMVEKHRGLPDGLKTDVTGHIWATGPGGVHLISPDGKLLARIDTKMACGNCCFGGDDGSWLYICSDAFLVRVPTKTRGRGL
ncbi:MAG: SMP-30/gluconolactonase/LRE family protein [Planctomycetota bacterium]